MMERQHLQTYLDSLLEVRNFRDYCPNGLQVEGCGHIERVVCGVTASQALIDVAIELEAQAVIVHHGYFWRGEDGRITGTRKRRLATLLAHDINLFAYHLPLDAHGELGNNAQLGRVLGWVTDGHCGENDLVCLATLDAPVSVQTLGEQVAAALGRQVQCLGDVHRPVRRVAWCSGAAQSYFEQALLAGADLFLSGEVSEPSFHLARESGAAYIAAGHHATERYGIQALSAHLTLHCGLDARFVDIDNPV